MTDFKGQTLPEILLGLYDCINSPEHTERLIEMVGEWLNHECNQPEIPLLEAHSRKAYDLCVDHISSRENEPTISIPMTELASDGFSKISVALNVQFYAETKHDFQTWLTGTRPHFLMRFVDQQGQTSLALVKRQKNALDIFINDPRLSDAARDLLRTHLGLTYSELMILDGIASGASTDEIAQKLSKSRETIRSQIKSVANKIGVSGQAKIAANLHLINRANSDSPRPETGLALADGRNIDFGEMGVHNGAVVLYFHCALHGRHLPKSIQSRLAARNIRLISMSRAGFGGSDLHEDTQDYLTKSAADYAMVLNNLGVKKVHLLAHGTGAAHAFKFAVLYPEIAQKVMMLDAVASIKSADDISRLHGLIKGAAMTARFAPAAFALMIRLANKRLASYDAKDKSFRRHILFPDVEIETLETADGLAAATQNVRDQRMHGLQGVLAEVMALRHDWAALPQNSNLRPATVMFRTENDPFMSQSGAQALAAELNSSLINLGPSFPYLEPHIDTILGQI